MPNFTKQAIIDVFTNLLDREPLDKIPVQEIVTECQISRNTFYYHFGDIYAVLDALVQRDIAVLRQRRREGASWDENMSRAIEYILENRRRISHIYRSLNHELLEHLFRQATEELFFEYVRGNAQGLAVSDGDLEAIVYFYQSAFVGGILDWMRRGMKDDLGVYLTKLHRLARGTTRRMLENAVQGETGAE